MSRGKKKLDPSASTNESRREKHSLYKYALEEYAQAVPPGSSNDDGSIFSGWSSSIMGGGGGGGGGRRTQHDPDSTGRQSTCSSSSVLMMMMIAAPSSVPSSRSIDENNNNGIGPHPATQQQGGGPGHHQRSSQHNNHADDNNSIHSDAATKSRHYQSHRHPHAHRRILSHPFRLDMPDATYEEIYGEAYTGGTIKYMYPSGYQSMRPRSGPWKLSIAIFLLFTWISIFIVVHCSDRADGYDYTTTVDDDHLIIDIRWCGSRPLYLMWVASMLVTGLSAAYCSVIGYIKVRDFAVANSRSQPPGVLDGKSDYYVSNEDNIYQADGEPQFWGSQIYRPTQAAVAVTSR